MNIKNNVKNTKTINVDQFLNDYTFNSLKESTNRDISKLKTAIKKRGFCVPIFVWDTFVIDGTGRKQVVTELVAEGFSFSEGIPVIEINAKNIEEAKQLALDISSQHGVITKESFTAFTESFNVDYDTINISDIDLSIENKPIKLDKDQEPEELDEENTFISDTHIFYIYNKMNKSLARKIITNSIKRDEGKTIVTGNAKEIKLLISEFVELTNNPKLLNELGNEIIWTE